MPHKRVPRTTAPGAACLRLPVLILALILLTPPDGAAADSDEDSCTGCHRDPGFLVTNKKLHDYFQQWDTSIHKQEGVGCVACHGGDPKAATKQEAHGDGVASSDPSSGIYYKNVHETCGRCHQEILEGFRESDHFEHLVEKRDEPQGPTCVTCHGAIDVDILNVNTVEESCARCHNEEDDNHPEIPEKARTFLNRFLSIHRFYRYITIKADPAEAAAFFQELDPRLSALAVTWHTFDIEAIDSGTSEVLGLLKAKREEIRNRRSKPASDPKDDEKP